MKDCYDTPLAPTRFTSSSNHVRFTAGDQLVVPRGVTHISCHYKNTMEGTGENKTNEQTRTMLGVNSRAEGKLCNTLCMCRLTLAWVTSETSTKQLECRLILTRSSFTGLDPIFSHWSHRSGVDCPCPWFHANSCSFVQPTLFSRPVTSFGHAEISSPKNPLSGFAPKQTKESSAWRATHIVLQDNSSLQSTVYGSKL